MKEYFSHDYNARNDTKLVKLFMKEGLKGVGAYWCIIEMLYEEGGYLLRSEYERISFELRTDLDFIISIIDNYDLFKKDKYKFWSETALGRLEKRLEKSEKAKQSVQARWNKYKRNTNVKQSENKSNTIKVKESKVKESKNIYRSFAHLKISIEENNKILELGYSQKQIDDVYDSIENYKKNTQYKSLYLTAKKWIKKEVPENKPTKKDDGIKRFTVLYDSDPIRYQHSESEIKKHIEIHQTRIRSKK